MLSIPLILYISASLPSVRAKPPNIIVMLADDLGWRDVSWHNDKMKTPDLESLARTGVRLDQSYFHPKCSPSRAALLTGYYPHRLGLQRSGVGRFHPYGLDTQYRILPQYLRQAGYRSHLVGKWHLGFCKKEFLPNHRGFDSFFGQWSHVLNYYTRMSPVKMLKRRNRKVRDGDDPKIGYDLHKDDDISTEYEGMFSTEMYAERSKLIIKEHNKTEPLFLMVSFQSPHNPFDTPPARFTSQYQSSGLPRQERDRAATVTALDAAVGDIVRSLKEEGLYDDSVILFSSDNGGAGDKYNSPLRGRKEELYEGGVRVISLVNSPLIQSPGTLYTGLVHVTDWFSSILHLAGLENLIPEDTSSVNVFPSIINMKPSPRSQIIHNIDEDRNIGSWQGVVRDGDYKLIWGSSRLLDKKLRKTKLKRNQRNFVQLFNIAEDPYERNELSETENKNLVKRLQRIILKEYKRTKFPSYHHNIESAFPKYNNGVFVTGWC